MGELPERIEEALRRLGAGATRLAVASDINREGRFGSEWLVVAGDTLRVVDGVSGAPLHQLEFDAFDELVIDDLVGRGIVLARKDGGQDAILSFSMAAAEPIRDAVGLINAWKKGEEPPAGRERHKRYCERCRKPLPKNVNTCPRCVNRRRVILRLWQFSLPYTVMMGLHLSLMLLGVGVGLLGPYISKILIDTVFVQEPAARFGAAGDPLDARPAVHESRPTIGLVRGRRAAARSGTAAGGRSPGGAGGFPNRWLLPYVALALLGSYAATALLTAISGRISGFIGHSVVADVRARLYEKLQSMSLAFFDRYPAGALMARVNQDTQELRQLLVGFLPMLIECVFMLVGIGVLLFVLSWRLTLFVLIPVGGVILFVKRVIPTYFVRFRRFLHRRGKLSAVVSDSLSGIRVVKTFGQEREEVRKFDHWNTAYTQAGIDVEKHFSTFHPILGLIIMSGSVIVWYVGGQLIFDASMTLGAVVAYSGYLMMFYRPIFMLTRISDMLTNALSASERVIEVLDAEPLIMDAASARDMPRIEGVLEFRNATFGYDRFKPVIKNLNLRIERNEMIGLVGKSGAGKSTVINLLCRLYDVDTGEIRIDGTDVRDIKLQDLRRQIGVVLQDTFLFNGTLLENIRYARPDATTDAVIAAARAANAHEFILQKPDGYDTEVGEKGSRLSGGEKQRIAIARAILRDPRILILDEATSSVDTETERKIHEALQRLIRGRTTIAIAHRLSTLNACDRLVVLKNGEIAEIGSHAELLAQKGIFHDLVQAQERLSKIVAVER